MGGHRIHPCHVCDNELFPAAASVEHRVRTVGRSLLLCVDSSRKELPADGDQRCGSHTVPRRAIQAFWLTVCHRDRIL